MKNVTLFLLLILVSLPGLGQAEADDQKVKRACLDYLEGFYEGDTAKLQRCLRPSLYKFGYWKSSKTGKYEADGQMTFQDALKFARNVRAKKNFPKPDAPKIVEVLGIMNHIAAAKVTAWWGVDFLLLSRQENGWLIDQALWEGPLEK